VECKGADGPNCLTTAQVETARAMYRGPIDPKTKQQISPGLFPGSELGWAVLAGSQSAVPIDYLRYAVFKDPNWDYRMLNLERDVRLADEADNGVINAADPNLKPFFSHGGKLLQYHGGSDNLIPPLSSINYYKEVLEKSGGKGRVNDSYRLFVVPGMAHCRGGEGVNSFDSIGVLEEWVENKKAPDRIVASRTVDGKVERTRPLCPFPQVATYKGTGSTDDAANFSCSPIK
jgi:feruloyl esterase